MRLSQVANSRWQVGNKSPESASAYYKQVHTIILSDLLIKTANSATMEFAVFIFSESWELGTENGKLHCSLPTGSLSQQGGGNYHSALLHLALLP